MAESERFRIVALEGYALRVGELVCMMDRVRARTMEAVDGLTVAQLDHLVDDRANSIGALLAHMAAIESVHAIVSFENRAPTPEERAGLGAALSLGDAARREIRGKPLGHYVDALAAVREGTKAQLRTKDDAWLLEERPYAGGARANNFYIWFHVPEDETNHRGQINWLRKRLPTIVP
jgi:uncharacterized damage-inducible protein DinB